MNTGGNINYFERLYDSYGDAVFRHFFFRLGDRERARELTQELFMRVWQYLASGKNIQHEKAFIFRIAHNMFVNEIRSAREARSLDEMMETGRFDVGDTSANTAEAANYHELLTLLSTLKESYRTVLIMRYLDGLGVAEIAALLGENETNISMRIKRALEKLRAAYGGAQPHSNSSTINDTDL